MRVATLSGMKINISRPWSWAPSLSSTQRSRGAFGNDLHREEAELLAISREPPTASLSQVTSTESGAPEEQNPVKPTRDEAITSTETDGDSAVPVLEDSNQPKTQRSTWIKGVYLCAYATVGLLLLNVVLVSVTGGLASRYPGSRGTSSSKVFYEGLCQTVSRWSTAFHVIVNIISTCTLAASNYCMQTLVAPTRSAIDIYHAKRRYLRIGGSSLRNLFAISYSQLGLWLILLLTATPFIYCTKLWPLTFSFPFFAVC